MEERHQPRDARELLSASHRAPAAPHTTTKPHPHATESKKPHPVSTFFTSCTCDYCYASTAFSSTATSRPPVEPRVSRWRQAAADTTRKKAKTPEPPRRSSQQEVTMARPPQPTDTDLRVLDELRRLVGQMESRFLQIVRLSRAQEDDLRVMRRAFKGNQ